MRYKRPLSEEAEEDAPILHSMSRRKRTASTAQFAPKCCRDRERNKEFKRQCDLTKHEKSHARPWKCPVEACKYHENGWPTEKEMDRHYNDKHSKPTRPGGLGTVGTFSTSRLACQVTKSAHVDAQADLVLDHGLNGDPWKMWTGKSGVLWPTELLPKTLDSKSSKYIYMVFAQYRILTDIS
jgi:hypothetical protein